jgi:predicted RNA binding protein YcfA (HicA-like mRNA interferase family)
MPKLPVLRPSRVVRALRRLGFGVERQKGSHLQLTRGNRLVTVPLHARDLNPAVLASILRQAGITAGQLLDAL